MPEFLKRVTDQITTYWNKLSTKTRIQLGVTVAIAMVALLVLSLILSQTNMVLYASDIPADKMNEITVILEEQEIKYEIRNNATDLYVDAKKKQDVTLAIDSLGIISDAKMTWTEALNNTFSTTSVEKQAKIILAFEEELNTNIEALDAIDQAWVKLDVAPQDTSIFDESKESSASLIVKTKEQLSQNQVMGIVNYLEKSVPNLTANNISIISTQADRLYDGNSEEEATGGIGNKMEYEVKKENMVEQSLRTVLLAGGAFDDATVLVDLALDFDVLEKMREDVLPMGDTGQGGITSDYESESTGTNANNSGAPGTDANSPTYVAPDSSTSDSKASVKETQYELGRLVTKEVKNIGGVIYDDSSVTVNLNNFVKFDQALLEKQGALKDITWEEFIEANSAVTIAEVDPVIIDLIKNATQIEKVSVVAYKVPLFIPIEEQENPIMNYIPVIVIVLLVILLGIAVYKGTAPVEITEIDTELSVEDLLVSTKTKQELDEIEFEGKSQTRKQIEKFVVENPEAVALLLRNWLNEDWE